MENAGKFREYAAECRRLMQQATAENCTRLQEIAAAWDRCAEAAELAESTEAMIAKTGARSAAKE